VAVAGRITELAEASLVEAQARREKGFREYDRQFHQAVADSAGNPVLRTAVEDSLMLTSVLRERDVPSSGDSIDCAREHVAIAAAIRGHDGERAGAAMAEHILHVMSIVLATQGKQN
jgi:GntR family transcriptional regulator, rspAB operon transcriptional repressor